ACGAGGRGVVLGRAAQDQERQAARQGGRRGQGDRAELRACEPPGLRLVLANGRRDRPPERPEQIGARLEPVFVQVVPGAPARPEDEVALEVRRVPQRRPQLRGGHAENSSRAIGSRIPASEESSANDWTEPSSAYRSTRSRLRAARRRTSIEPAS